MRRLFALVLVLASIAALGGTACSPGGGGGNPGSSGAPGY
jgi:hypothetical protein